MSRTQPTKDISYYLISGAIRFAINLFKLSLLAAFIGVLVFSFIIMYLFTSTGDGAVPIVSAWIDPVAKNLFSILGEGPISSADGGMEQFGYPLLGYFAPFIIAINVVVSVTEALIEKSLFQWFHWSLRSRLLTLLVVFFVFIMLSVFGSNVSYGEVPSWMRVVILGAMWIWATGQFLILHGVGWASEALLSAFIRQYFDQYFDT